MHLDISYALNQLCQHVYSPTVTHWFLLKHVLWYVKGMLHYGMCLHKSFSLDLYAFLKFDWVDCPDDHKSMSGFEVFLGSNLISWVCKKQRTVAQSSTEADVSAKVTCLVSLLHELGVSSLPIHKLWCDNLGMTYMCANPVFHARTKHVACEN